MEIGEWRRKPLSTSYLFVVYNDFFEEEVSLICGYLITVIADGLMVRDFQSKHIINR